MVRLKKINGIKVSKDAWWIRFGNPQQSSSFSGDLAGKYLFFSKSQKALIQIATDEILKFSFQIAKVSIKATEEGFVLCLYWNDDKRKKELAERYKQRSDIKYCYWISNELTHTGIYSPDFLAD